MTADLEDAVELMSEIRRTGQMVQDELTSSAQMVKNELTASARQLSVSLDDLSSTVTSIREAVDGVLAITPQTCLTRNQQRVLKDTFACCICRGLSKFC